jgi:TPR repeat protein
MHVRAHISFIHSFITVGMYVCLWYNIAYVKRDGDKAMTLYQRSASLGHARGIFLTACSFQDGTGCELSLKEAVKWWQKGVDDYNDASCAARLAECYASGDGVDKDEVKSLSYYQRSLDGFNYDAARTIGDAYCTGTGTTKDLKQAERYYHIAAYRGGSSEAYYSYARFLLENDDVSVRNEKKGAYLMKLAAAQKLPLALFGCGMLYDTGLGVPTVSHSIKQSIHSALSTIVVTYVT